MDFTRKNIRLRHECYLGFQYYFLTLCCHERMPLFRNPEIINCLVPLLVEHTAKHSFALPAFCFMPDHLHLLLEGKSATSNAIACVTSFKQASGFQSNKSKGIRLWQRYFYDHILRSEDSAEAVAWYIWLNPVRAGISQRAEEYPYSGSLTTDWKAIGKPDARWTPPWKSNAAQPSPQQQVSG